MLAMMDIMGMIDYERDYYNQPYPNYNTMPYASGYYPYQFPPQSLAWQQIISGGYPGGTQAAIPYLPKYFGQFPGQWQNLYSPQNPAYRKHWIEGRWVARDNMIMEVENGKFIMYYRDDPKQVRGGLIRLKDRWLAIAEETRKVTRQYEYAYRKDVLILRDEDGNMMVFRRLTDWPIRLQKKYQ